MLENKQILSYIHLHFIVFIWGFTAVLGKLIHINAIPLVWYRMSLATLFILAYFLVRQKRLKIAPKEFLVFLISGAIVALHWVTFFMAIKESNVSIALVMMSTGAFFTSFIEPVFFKRKINTLELIFGLLVVAGIYFIFKVEEDHIFGILLALFSAFLSALFAVINGVLVKTKDASLISFYQLFFGVICITIYLGFTAGFTEQFFELSKTDWLYLLLLSSICTAYAFIASVHVMKQLTPYTVMLTINLEPIYGIILATLIFKETEQMKPAFYIGALLILSVVIINGIIKNKLKNSVLKKER